MDLSNQQNTQCVEKVFNCVLRNSLVKNCQFLNKSLYSVRSIRSHFYTSIYLRILYFYVSCAISNIFLETKGIGRRSRKYALQL